MKLNKHVAMVFPYLGITSKSFTKHINISIIFVHICICMYVYTHKYIHKRIQSHYYEFRWLNVADMQEEIFPLPFPPSRCLGKPNQIREKHKIKYYFYVEVMG